MSALRLDVLTNEEREAFPLLKHFADIGILVGGTALTLQIGHRRSYDFDIFLKESLSSNLARRARKIFGALTIVNDFEEELTFTTAAQLKITFVYYPFPQIYAPVSTPSIAIADLKDIALDKAYTIGRRAQYRDYVDLFFLLKERKIALPWIIENAVKKFGDLFPEKLFLEQLIYFDDLKKFPIEFLGVSYGREEVQSSLEKEVAAYTQEKI